MEHLLKSAGRFGVGLVDLDGLLVTDQVPSRHNGATHVYLQQQLAGLPVANGTVSVAVDSAGEVSFVGERLVGALALRAGARVPSLSADEAILRAADQLGLGEPAALESLERQGGATREELFRAPALSRDDIPVKLAWYALPDGEVRLAWELVIHQPDGRHWWQLWVDAGEGGILAKADWIDWDTYEVFPLPQESPSDGPRAVEANPADSVASPLDWHKIADGGAEFTDTRGNNVHAQEDRDGNDIGGFRPSSASRDFAFPLDLATEEPEDYQDVAVTNLFYWNNVLHDVLYRYGFDEPAGNFQQNNFGLGGAGSDAVQADAQDGSGFNNANFSTPPDGLDARMQMFEWLSPRRLTVHSPSAIAGDYPAAPATFGQQPSLTGISGALKLANDGSTGGGGTITDGCQHFPAAFFDGSVALIDRGGCEFGTKVLNAEEAGAIAAIVVNNQGDGLFTMRPGKNRSSVTIPSALIGRSDGDTLKAHLASGVDATLAAESVNRDSDLDNGIIAHEYCHGLSNRLTGGPGSSDCLNWGSFPQVASEGWSDFCALFVTAAPGDGAETARGIGTYVTFQAADGPGIRAHPYSTDMGVNPLTYGDISSACNGGCLLTIPHGVGTVWATALWEMYWALVDRYGFDPDPYEGTGGNNIAMQLVVDGLKLQPCSPSFLDARDAILAADGIGYGGANRCLIWKAFAKRGMGLSADDGGSAATLAVTEDFTLPGDCVNIAPSVTVTGPAEGATFGSGDTIDLTGSASDPEDGDLTGDLEWESDLDGPLGGGGSLSVSLSAGYHTITASVSDSEGLSGSEALHLVVEAPPGCPAAKTLEEHTVSTGTEETYRAVGTLTVGGAVTVETAAKLIARAGVMVEFVGPVTIDGELEVQVLSDVCEPAAITGPLPGN